MHIVVFHQYHHNPDCAATGRHYTFMARWARHHDVTLVTTDAWAAKRLTHRYPWVPEGVRLVERHVPYDNTMSVGARLWAFARYAASSLLDGLRLPRPDVVLGTSTPLTAALAAALVARRHGAPWVFEVRDLWPDFPIQMGAVPLRPLQRLLYGLEHALYRAADHVVTLSPDMEAHVRRIRTGDVTTLLNGTDLTMMQAGGPADVAALRARHDLEDRRVVLYAGTLGRANNVPLLIEAAERLRHRTDLALVVLGHGYHRDRIAAAAERLPALRLLPPQPRHAMGAWYRLADLSLIPFLDLPVLAANSPAKFFDSLGAGTPVVVTNPGWTRTFVETHGCGWYSPAHDPAALAERLDALTQDPDRLAAAGARGLAVARTLFDRRTLADQMEALLLDVARRGRHRRTIPPTGPRHA